MSWADSAAVWTDFLYMFCISAFTSSQILYLYLIISVLVVCHFNILLTEPGVMHETGYVYSIWRT